MANTWPGGFRHAMHQNEHEAWNAKNYPGTRQLCARCDEPTGRCEEDTLWSGGEDQIPLCEECYDAERCDTCQGDGCVEDRSGNFPGRPGVNAGPFIEYMECPTCCGTGKRKEATP